MATTPGRRAVLEWWNARGFPAEHFPTLVQVGVESPEDVPFVQFDDLEQFRMPAHVAREVRVFLRFFCVPACVRMYVRGRARVSRGARA